MSLSETYRCLSSCLYEQHMETPRSDGLKSFETPAQWEEALADPGFSPSEVYMGDSPLVSANKKWQIVHVATGDRALEYGDVDKALKNYWEAVQRVENTGLYRKISELCEVKGDFLGAMRAMESCSGLYDELISDTLGGDCRKLYERQEQVAKEWERLALKHGAQLRDRAASPFRLSSP